MDRIEENGMYPSPVLKGSEDPKFAGSRASKRARGMARIEEYGLVPDKQFDEGHFWDFLFS